MGKKTMNMNEREVCHLFIYTMKNWVVIKEMGEFKIFAHWLLLQIPFLLPLWFKNQGGENIMSVRKNEYEWERGGSLWHFDMLHNNPVSGIYVTPFTSSKHNKQFTYRYFCLNYACAVQNTFFLKATYQLSILNYPSASNCVGLKPTVSSALTFNPHVLLCMLCW